MNLKDLLLEKKSAVLKRWLEIVLESYPADTSDFFKKQKNRFANPVGYALSQGVEGIFDDLLQGVEPEEVTPLLDSIIRIKAVQDFSPSQAISFIFFLKRVIREELGSKISTDRMYEELLAFESKIDDLALVSFDIYMKCREKVYEIKADEVRRMTFRLLQRANLICEIKEESDLESETLLTNNKKG